ncbi:sensor histidine kinase [Algoriphagus sp. CAU 1675]|uniref:sensor histidine kinase n=1 Tax=Algoriphagus sp. CAU 1675 TaxID=3032597 RepID=UPI0023D9843F|nr:sensor histidine kinase [Algoriphagus sp. CAU 1675]MDF2157225.1 histidine kinase [Algoriphagus sp. CAU 1675]
MNKFLARLQVTPGFLLFTVLFAYLDSIRSRIAPGQVVNALTFTPESALAAIPTVLLTIVLIRYVFIWVHGEHYPMIKSKAILSFFMAMLAFFLLSNLLSFGLSTVFGTVDRNFVREILIRVNFSRILDFVVYGGFYFAFLLFQKFKEHQNVLASYELALAESKIKQLKQQLNPHFLFNNLNVLDQLIEENPKSASVFLNDFSELYRYALEKSELKLVPLKEEVAFAENYFRLILHKFGKGYELQILDHSKEESLIPPMTLQVLLENVVFHNHGTDQEPVKIQIEIGDSICITNSLKPYKFQKHSGGIGLKNLQKQYALLADTPIKIEKREDLFVVDLPLLTNIEK